MQLLWGNLALQSLLSLAYAMYLTKYLSKYFRVLVTTIS